MKRGPMESQESNVADNNVSIDDLVCAIKRTDKGLAILLKPRTRSELIQAYGELQIAIINEVLRLRDEVVHKPGIMDFVRKKR